MNKKVGTNKKKYDDTEDLEIKEVAYFKNSSQVILLFVLIILFGFTLFSSLVFIGKYYRDDNKNAEVIEINNKNSRILITSLDDIDKKVLASDLESKEDIVLENTSNITFKTNSSAKEAGKIFFDVKYNILENNFYNNLIATNDSDLLVRFSYSFDNENWTYVNNVISTDSSNLSPLMGNYYDIAGLNTNLSIETNYELTTNPGEEKTMYWKSETIIKNANNNIDKSIKANFKVEYKEN